MDGWITCISSQNFINQKWSLMPIKGGMCLKIKLLQMYGQQCTVYTQFFTEHTEIKMLWKVFYLWNVHVGVKTHNCLCCRYFTYKRFDWQTKWLLRSGQAEKKTTLFTLCATLFKTFYLSWSVVLLHHKLAIRDYFNKVEWLTLSEITALTNLLLHLFGNNII